MFSNVNNIIKKYFFSVKNAFDHHSNLRRIVDNISWLFMDKIIRMVFGLLVGVWLARYLGPDQYGLLNYAIAFMGIIATISQPNLNTVVVRDLINSPAKAEETLGTAFVIQLIGGIVSLILALVCIAFLRPQEELIKSIIIVLGLVTVFKATEVIKWWFESLIISKYTVWIENTIFVIVAVVKLLLIFMQAPFMAFVWAIFLEAALVSIGLIGLFFWREGHFLKWQMHLDRAKSLVLESWPITFWIVAVMISMRVDQVMLGQIIGDEAVGIYAVAVRLSEVWYFIPVAVVASVFPAIVEAKKQSKELYYQRLQKLYDLMVVLALCIAVAMTFLARWLIVLLFGRIYESAGVVLAIHIWGIIFVFFGTAWSRWMIIEGFQKTMLKMNLISLGINIILNYLLIPQYGPAGAATATVISVFFVHTVCALFFNNQRTAIIMLLRTFLFFKKVNKL